ncbi:hypothetical protein HPB48_006336 [Haemaphysalis longicornis]|uniref:Uncharacterized protein n=1 Tax=Haemaphysalis longicornis TaxID=44386 RepID=A0A9J6GX66_HAELO|nr:hypothetical protein HPB48_006336 [Haemaphysalis longicornis]
MSDLQMQAMKAARLIVDAAPSTSQAENDQLIDEGDHDSEYCGSEYSYDSDDESDSGFLDVSDEDGMLHSRFAQFDDQTLPNSQVTRSGAIAAIMSFAVAHGPDMVSPW